MTAVKRLAMSGEEAALRGYFATSNGHRLASRLDRQDWLEYMAEKMGTATADFREVRPNGTLGGVTRGWTEYYLRTYSKDTIELAPAAFAELKELRKTRYRGASTYVSTDEARARIEHYNAERAKQKREQEQAQDSPEPACGTAAQKQAEEYLEELEACGELATRSWGTHAPDGPPVRRRFGAMYKCRLCGETKLSAAEGSYFTHFAALKNLPPCILHLCKDGRAGMAYALGVQAAPDDTAPGAGKV